ncbi:hypothetical protein BGX21_007535 [Mortierella sp. AD011]|nr:hypothetical protein BGX21_007535 [Mortierella sp. AD011]
MKLLSVSALSLVLLSTLATASKPTVYLIRHGEKPSDGSTGLSSAGEQRAQCLRKVFGASSDYNIGYIMAQAYKSDRGQQPMPMQPQPNGQPQQQPQQQQPPQLQQQQQQQQLQLQQQQAQFHQQRPPLPQHLPQQPIQYQPQMPQAIDEMTIIDGSRERPFLTVEPLAEDLGLTVDTSCDRDDPKCVKNAVKNYKRSGNILICWEHDALTDIVESLGDNDAPEYPDNE